MTAPRPRIVVTLAARSVAEARAQIDRAARSGADAAELRVDRLAPGELSAIPSLFPSPIPLVATYRSRAEGGGGEDDGAARRPILTALARAPFRWLDLELARDLGTLPDLPPIEAIGRIVSSHLRELGGERWLARLRELEEVDGIGKLVVPATVDELLRTIVPRLGPGGEELVVHTTGPSGPLLRGWARRFGFPLVYASLPEEDGALAVEPSQIPVDRLRPYLDADEPAPLFAVVGRPVAHSRSPALHADWMRATGDVGLYVPIELRDEREFLDALGPLAAGGFRGLNVTHPYKAVAFEAATELGRAAAACGTVNCLTFEHDAVLGENTDLVAILRRFEELLRAGRWDGRRVTVVGAGGAARATVAAARELGAQPTICARRPEAARELAGTLGAFATPAAEAAAAPLLVHATPVGRDAGARLDPPIGPLVARGGHVIDWVYDPDDPAVRAAAEGAGASYEDGRRLLVYQAAASYALWWGHPPSPEAVARALPEDPWPA